MANLITIRQRINIANQLVRFTHIRPNDSLQGPIKTALICKLHDGDVQAFLIN